MINNDFEFRKQCMRFTAVILVSLLLIACGNKKTSADKKSPRTEAEGGGNGSDAPDLTALRDNFSENGDSITIPEFEIEISLSNEAEKKLKDSRESIIVQAYISGIPKKRARVQVTEMGELNLCTPRVELTKSRVARFKNVNIARSDYGSLEDEDFQVLINVFSGRRSSEANLLDCDILQEPISVVRARRHVLSGKLIGQ